MNEELSYFSDQDYLDLMFPINTVPVRTSILKHFPLLGKCQEFKLPLYVELESTSKKKKDEPEMRELDREKVIRYIIYLYDMGSKINVRKDPKEMRKFAAINSGFSINDTGRFDKEVELMLQGRVENVNFMAIRFARFFHNMTYSQLVTTCITYFATEHKLVQNSKTFKDEDTKGSIYSSMKKMGEDIEALSLKLLSHDKNPWLREDLFCTIDKAIDEELMLSPEKMAEEYDEEE